MLVRPIATALTVCFLALVHGNPASADDAGRRVRVFNGKNLDGWQVSRCQAGVEDGCLVLQDGNGLVYLNDRYDDYILEFKWRARRDAKWDSGVYFRCDLPGAAGGPWPQRYQVNLRQDMEGNVGNLPGAKSQGLVKPGQWNQMKLTVIGPTAKLEFNGQPAWEAEGLEQYEGLIALQAEVSGGGQFEFKDIYVTELNRESLFNGKDLTGWFNINCAPGTWRAEDGMIRCTGFPTGQMRTDRMYENFVLDVEWRHLKPKGNAGIMVWADGVTAPGVPFCRAVEVQVLDGREDDWYTSDGDVFPIHGATMKPENARGGMRAFPTEPRAKPSPEWNHFRISCTGGTIRLAVNGKIVTQGHECSLRKGYICLESEGSPVDFRNLWIKELPPGKTRLEDDQIALHVCNDRPFIPLYSGVDLSGWEIKADDKDHWKSQDWRLVHDPEGSSAKSTIWSEKRFRDFELILDAKLPKNAKDGQAAIVLVGTEISLTGATPGQWRRYRVILQDGRITVTVDDETVVNNKQVADPAMPTAIGLSNRGARIELANILIRELPDKR
jgi:3-keto-disaccharide hydrolase